MSFLTAKVAAASVGLVGVAGLALVPRRLESAAARLAQAKLCNSANASDLRGKHAVVVGGTSGIGHGIAVRLAEAGCSVTIVGRSPQRGAAVVEELQKKSSSGGGEYSFAPLDATSLPACAEFAARIVESRKAVDYLVLTQGMATLQGYTPTSPEQGGLDQKLTLHYFSRVLLANELGPALAKSNDPRVLSVLSAGVHSAFAGAAQDFDLISTYSIKNAADAAGYYNDLGLDALSEKHPTVSFVHACPGFVATNWGTEMPALVRRLVRLLQVFGKSKEDCGEYMCGPLLDPKLKGGGFSLRNEYGEPLPKMQGHDAASKALVWANTRARLAPYFATN